MKYAVCIMLFVFIGCSSKQDIYHHTEYDEKDLDTLLCEADKTECKPIKKNPKQ